MKPRLHYMRTNCKVIATWVNSRQCLLTECVLIRELIIRVVVSFYAHVVEQIRHRSLTPFVNALCVHQRVRGKSPPCATF